MQSLNQIHPSFQPLFKLVQLGQKPHGKTLLSMLPDITASNFDSAKQFFMLCKRNAQPLHYDILVGERKLKAGLTQSISGRNVISYWNMLFDPTQIHNSCSF